MLPESPFVPLVEVCRTLQEPYARIHGAVVAGRIPAERRGGRWFVTRATLATLIAERRAASESALALAHAVA